MKKLFSILVLAFILLVVGGCTAPTETEEYLDLYDLYEATASKRDDQLEQILDLDARILELSDVNFELVDKIADLELIVAKLESDNQISVDEIALLSDTIDTMFTQEELEAYAEQYAIDNPVIEEVIKYKTRTRTVTETVYVDKDMGEYTDEQYVALLEDYNAKVTEIEGLQTTITEHEATIESLSSAKLSLETTITDLEIALESELLKNSELEDTVATMQSVIDSMYTVEEVDTMFEEFITLIDEQVLGIELFGETEEDDGWFGLTIDWLNENGYEFTYEGFAIDYTLYDVLVAQDELYESIINTLTTEIADLEVEIILLEETRLTLIAERDAWIVEYETAVEDYNLLVDDYNLLIEDFVTPTLTYLEILEADGWFVDWEAETLSEVFDGLYVQIDTYITGLQGEVNSLTAERNTLLATVDSKDIEILALGSQIAQLNDEIASLTEVNATLTTMIETLESTITTLEGTVAENDTLISSLQSTIAEKETEITNLNTTIDTLNGTIASLEAELVEATGDITELEGTIATLNATVTTLQDQVAVLEGEIATYESDIQEAYTVLLANEVTSIDPEADFLTNLYNALAQVDGWIQKDQETINTLATYYGAIDVLEYTEELTFAIETNSGLAEVQFDIYGDKSGSLGNEWDYASDIDRLDFNVEADTIDLVKASEEGQAFMEAYGIVDVVFVDSSVKITLDTTNAFWHTGEWDFLVSFIDVDGTVYGENNYNAGTPNVFTYFIR